MEKCPNPICEQNKNLLFKDCPICRTFWWYPNVEMANQLEEREALELNYNIAEREADARGSRDQLNKFERAASNSFVFINMRDKELEQFLSRIENTQKREDSKVLVQIMEEESGFKAYLTGSIIGFSRVLMQMEVKRV